MTWVVCLRTWERSRTTQGSPCLNHWGFRSSELVLLEHHTYFSDAGLWMVWASPAKIWTWEGFDSKTSSSKGRVGVVSGWHHFREAPYASPQACLLGSLAQRMAPKDRDIVSKRIQTKKLGTGMATTLPNMITCIRTPECLLKCKLLLPFPLPPNNGIR